MNTTKIENLIADFAKTHKIGKAKVTEFARLVASQYASPGRPVSEDTQQLRNKVREYVLSTDNQFTSKDVAAAIGSDNLSVNNALNFLKKTEGVVEVVGHDSKGQRGRPQVIWESK